MLGKKLEHWENGNLKSLWCEEGLEKKRGRYIEYENGIIRKIVNICQSENGKSHFDGEYYLNKKYVIKQGEYKLNQFSGTIKYLYPSGQMKSFIYLKNGGRIGKYREWYSNGKLKVLGNYKAGKKYGEWLFFQSNGDLEDIHIFQKDI